MSGYITRGFAEKFRAKVSGASADCRAKFLRFFPKGFYDEKYIAWERGYKDRAHQLWMDELNQKEFEALLKHKHYREIAERAVRIESKTNLLFSFEKMALRDAIKIGTGARAFSEGLHDLLYG